MPNQVPSAPLGSIQSRGREASRGTYRGFGFCGLGLLQSCFADIQVQTPVLQEPPLFLQVGIGTVRRWAALREPGPWQDWPRGPSEAQRRKVIHSEQQSTGASSGEAPGGLGSQHGRRALLSGSGERAAMVTRRRVVPGPSLTEIVFQSPSRKLRRGVRKLMEAAWIKSRSAAPRRFSASDTLIRVFPENRLEGEKEGQAEALVTQEVAGGSEGDSSKRPPQGRLAWKNVGATYTFIPPSGTDK